MAEGKSPLFQDIGFKARMWVKASANREKEGEQSLSLQFRVSMTPIDKTLTLLEHRHLSRHVEF